MAVSSKQLVLAEGQTKQPLSTKSSFKPSKQQKKSLYILIALGLVCFGVQAKQAHAAISLVATSSATAGGSSVTTPAINTTGASLIVVVGSTNAGTSTVSDNKSNTWHVLSTWAGGNNDIQIFYAYTPTTSSTQTFTITSVGSGNYPSLVVSAWSGTLATSAVFDTQNGSSTTNSVTSFGTGSITPASMGELLIGGLGMGPCTAPTNISLSPGFSILGSNGVTGCQGEAVSSAYLIDSSTNAIGPQWSWSPIVGGVVTDIAAFESAVPSISSFSASPSAIGSGASSTLSWNVTNASSVAITPGSFSTSTLIASTTVSPTSTTIYTLTATNANGTSTATTTVTVDNTTPTTPTSVVATAFSGSQINLTWASSTDSGGSGIAGYNIFRCTGGACTPNTRVATSSGALYSDTGLSASTTYTYAIQAYNGVGTVSATSTTASATTLPPNTIDAASCSESAVQTAISNASSGYTVVIPSGTCTWTSELSITTPITLTGTGTPNSGSGTTGAATPSTIIIDNGGSSNPLMLFEPSYGSPDVRLSMLAIDPYSTSTALTDPIWIEGACAAGGCPYVRIDNLTFGLNTYWSEGGNGSNAEAGILAENVFGVVDHNTIGSIATPANNFELFNAQLGSYLGIGQYGDNSWVQPDSFGGANNLYAENNLDYDAGYLPMTDAEQDSEFAIRGGSRVVARDNVLHQGSGNTGGYGLFQDHGTDSGGRARGSREAEVYDNFIYCDGTTTNCSGVDGALRSGTGLFFGNSFTSALGSGPWVSLALYRNDTASWSPFSPNCGGFDPWDNNDNASVSSVYTITSTSTGAINDTSAGWTAGQFAPVAGSNAYLFYDVTASANPVVAAITGNTATQLSLGAFTGGTPSPGDTFVIVGSHLYYAGTVTAVSGTGGTGNTGMTNSAANFGSTNSLIPSGAPYSVFDATGGWGGEISGNTSTTITVQGYIGYGPYGFSVSDTYWVTRATVCIDQPTRGQQTSSMLSGLPISPIGVVTESIDPVYQWDDTTTEASTNGNITSGSLRLIANRDYYAQAGGIQTTSTSPFNGTSGTGWGIFADRPMTCTANPEGGGSAGVGYFATDADNGNGILYTCNATNTWVAHYQPAPYPYALTASGLPNDPTLTTTSTLANEGSISQFPTGQNFIAGTNVTLTANASSGYVFSGWTGSVTTSTNPLAVTVNSNMTLAANFTSQASSTPAITSFSAAPSEVLSTGTSTLSWNISNASSVAVTPGSFSTSTLIASTTVNPTSTTLYTLTATNGNGTSTATTTVTVDIVTPTTPASVVATATGTSTISLTWASSTDGSGPGLAGYNIFRCAGSCTPSTSIATSSGASYNDSGLTASTTYTYAVSAYDTLGLTSATSTNASATTPSAALPSISSFSFSSSSITLGSSSLLSWNVSNASSVALSGNNLSFSTSTASSSVSVTPDATGTFVYTLSASNTNGTSTATTSIMVAAENTTSSPPQNLSATPSNASVSLSWDTPSSNGGSALTEYLVYDRFTGSSTFAFYSTTSPSVTTSTVSSLTNGQSYDFEIIAQNGVGTSTPSNIVSSTPYTIPNPPTSVSATAGNAEATVSFSAPTSTGGSPILYYTATSNPGSISASSTAAPISVQNLTNGQSYTFTVTATNAAGTSASSSPSNSVTPTSSAPLIASFSASPLYTQPDITSTLSWSVSNASSVTITPGNFSTSTLAGAWDVNPTSTTTYILTALSNGNGTSTAETTITVQSTPPSVPTGLSANAVSVSEIDLSWTASTSTIPIAGYDVYQDSTKIATTSATSYQSTGLSPNTTYSYTVDAFDAAGNVSGESSSTSATTQVQQSGSGGGGGGGGGGCYYNCSYGGSSSTSTPSSTGSGSSSSLLATLLAELEALIKAMNTQLVTSFTRNLTIGSRGTDVQNLQIFLNDNGYPIASSGAGSIGKESTYFGAKTQEALAKWQKANHLPATGFFGGLTRGEMEKLY